MAVVGKDCDYQLSESQDHRDNSQSAARSAVTFDHLALSRSFEHEITRRTGHGPRRTTGLQMGPKTTVNYTGKKHVSMLYSEENELTEVNSVEQHFAGSADFQGGHIDMASVVAQVLCVCV